tara:strand:- start:118 stop:441 length:324 start_codon:yes stop_codon:yes gene_type:complete
MDYQVIGYKVIDWLSDYWDVHPEVLFYPVTHEQIQCCGQSYEHEWELGTYVIEVSIDQSLRDFVATVVHEMVHVKQWLRQRWWKDGEGEANRLQYKLADKFWKEGLL